MSNAAKATSNTATDESSPAARPLSTQLSGGRDIAVEPEEISRIVAAFDG